MTKPLESADTLAFLGVVDMNTGPDRTAVVVMETTYRVQLYNRDRMKAGFLGEPEHEGGRAYRTREEATDDGEVFAAQSGDFYFRVVPCTKLTDARGAMKP